MSVLDDIVDAPMSITGELWFCADSEQPTKTGAGRGAKQFVSIEDNHLFVYASRKTQTKTVYEVHFRSMKQAAWFTHHPKLPPSNAIGATGVRRGVTSAAAKDPAKVIYYYLVLELVRDPALAINANLKKREHVVLCTDDKQDFDIWKKFAELYEAEPSPTQMKESATALKQAEAAAAATPAAAKKAVKAITAEPKLAATPSPSPSSSISSDADAADAYGRRAFELWRNRCVALLNDFAHLSDPALQVKSADDFDGEGGGVSGGLSWDARAEAVVHAVERDMRPALKVLPITTTEDAAGPSFSAATSAATSSLMASNGRGMHVDDLRSQLNHVTVEMEQFQAAAAELGSYVEGKEVPAQTMSPDALRGFLARLQQSFATPHRGRGMAKEVDSGPLGHAYLPPVNTTTATGGAALERACRSAVSAFTERVHSSALTLEEEANREKAVQQERTALPHRVELVFSVLLDELSHARDTTAKLRATLQERSAPASPLPTSITLEMNELRKTLNRKEMELEMTQQQHFDESRRAKQLSRCVEAAVVLYTEVTQDMVRSQYREYASLRGLFLYALRGDGLSENGNQTTTDAAAVSNSAGPTLGLSAEGRREELTSLSRGAGKLVISTAHLETVVALEKERQVAKVKQQRLEDVITELDALRQDRDAEIANLNANFLAAKEAWSKDVAVLQAKLTALQSSLPRGAVLLPASAPTAAEVVGITQRLKGSSAPAALETKILTSEAVAGVSGVPSTPSTDRLSANILASHQTLVRVATHLAVSSDESNVNAFDLSERLQAFYEWALNSVVPLAPTSSINESLLETIIKVVDAYQAAFQQIYAIYNTSKSSTRAEHTDVLSLVKEEHALFTQLCHIIQHSLLETATEINVYPGAELDDAKAELVQVPTLSFPITSDQLNHLKSYLNVVSDQLHFAQQLYTRCGKTNLIARIQNLEERSRQLDTSLKAQERQNETIDNLEKELEAQGSQLQKNKAFIFSALAALGVDAESEEPVGAAVARAAAAAAERERDLRATVEAATERERALEAELAATREAAGVEIAALSELLEATRKAALLNHSRLRSKLDDAKQSKKKLRCLLNEVSLHDDRWVPKDECSVATWHEKSFDGDEWRVLLKLHPEELKQLFVADVSSACHVLQRDITHVSFRLGSLVVKFAVQHAASVSTDEINSRLSECPFNNVMDLYTRRLESKNSIDLLQSRVGELVEEVDSTRIELRAEKAVSTQLQELIHRAMQQLVTASQIAGRGGSSIVEKSTEVAQHMQQQREALEDNEVRLAAVTEELENMRLALGEKHRQETQLRRGLKQQTDVINQLQLTVSECEYREALLLTSVSATPFAPISGENISTLSQMCALLNCSVSGPRGALEELRKVLQQLAEYSEKQRMEVIWYRDPFAVAAAQRLHSVLPSLAHDWPKSDEANGEVWHAQLLHTLKVACDELQSERAAHMQATLEANAIHSLLEKACASLQNTWSLLSENIFCSSVLLSRAETPLSEKLHFWCQGLAAVAASCENQRSEMRDKLKSVYTTLLAATSASPVQAVHEAHGDETMCLSTEVAAGKQEPSGLQVLQLAQCLVNEVASLRDVAATVPALAAAMHQRDALAQAVLTSYSTLRKAANESGAVCSKTFCLSGDVSLIDMSPDAQISSEHATTMLGDATAFTSSALRLYTSNVTRAVSILEVICTGDNTDEDGGQSVHRLIDLAAAVQLHVQQLKQEQRRLVQLQNRERTERQQSCFMLKSEIAALRDRCAVDELEHSSVADELAALKVKAAGMHCRWKEVTHLFTEFAQDVHDAVCVTPTAQVSDCPADDVAMLIQRCTSLEEGERAATESLRTRLAAVKNVCQRCSRDLQRAESQVTTLTQQLTVLMARAASLEKQVLDLSIQLEASRQLAAEKSQDLLTQMEAAAKEKSGMAAAHRASLEAAEAARAALEVKAHEQSLDNTRQSTEVKLTTEQLSREQARVGQLEAALKKREADVFACLTAVGDVDSLAEVSEQVAMLRVQHKKRYLEEREARQRREVVQEWATTMDFLSAEVRSLWGLVGATAQHFPGTPLHGIAHEVRRLQHEVAEAELLLGDTVNAASADGAASRVSLLQAVNELHDLFYASTGGLYAQVSSNECSVHSAPLSVCSTREVAHAAAAWRAAPEKLVKAVTRLVSDFRRSQVSQEEAEKREQVWHSCVAHACSGLQSALSAFCDVHHAGQGVSTSPDTANTLMNFAVSRSTSPIQQDGQASTLRTLRTTVNCANEQLSTHARLFQTIRETLQSCLASPETSLPALVRAVVEEVNSLRRASIAAGQTQRRSDEAVATLTDLVQQASAALPGDAAFLQFLSQTSSALTQPSPPLPRCGCYNAAGLELLDKCVAYAKECARLSSQEAELRRVLGAAVAQSTPLGAQNASSLLSLTESAVQELVELRERVVPRLLAMLRHSAIEALTQEETADRIALCAAELKNRASVGYAPCLRSLQSLYMETYARGEGHVRELNKLSEECGSLRAASSALEAAALKLLPGQVRCQEVVTHCAKKTISTQEGNVARDALSVLTNEAGLMNQLVEAHAQLIEHLAQQSKIAEELASKHEEREQHSRRKLRAAEDTAKELLGQIDAVAGFVADICDTLKLDKFVSNQGGIDVDSSDDVRRSLPLIKKSVQQMTQQLAGKNQAICYLEERNTALAGAVETAQQQCQTAEARARALQGAADRASHAESAEVATLRSELRRMTEAHDNLLRTLSNSTVLPSPLLSPLSIEARGDFSSSGRERAAAWHALHSAVEWLVEELERRVACEAESAAAHAALQSRADTMNRVIEDKQATEAELVHRLNTALATHVSFDGAADLASASADDPVTAVEQLAELCTKHAQTLEACAQEKADIVLKQSHLLQDLRAAEDRCNDQGAAQAAAEKRCNALQKELAEVHAILATALAATRARTASVLPETAFPASVSSFSVTEYVGSMHQMVDALLFRVQQSHEVSGQLSRLNDESGNETRSSQPEQHANSATEQLATLWSVLHEELLSQLLEDADGGQEGTRDGEQPQHLDFLTTLTAFSTEFPLDGSAVVDGPIPTVGNAMFDAAVVAVREAARRLRDLHANLQDIHAFLQSTFGEAATTNPSLPGIVHASQSSAMGLVRVRVRPDRLADTVHATAGLIHGVVAAKCASTAMFLQEVETNVLKRPMSFAKVSFASLRPAPFMEWLRHLLDDLYNMQTVSEHHCRQVRQLPLFMDALVEVVHSRGGRVDLGCFQQPDACHLTGLEAPCVCHSTAAVDNVVERNEAWQEREKEALLDGLQNLLANQEAKIQQLASDYDDVVMQCRQLTQEQAAAEHVMIELRHRVQEKVQEDQKLEASLRALDRHLDAQARELALKYQAEQNAIAHRFAAMRSTLHEALQSAHASSGAYRSPHSAKRGRSTSKK